jgi:hypothetical protein
MIMFVSLESTLRVTAVLAIATVLGMVGIFVVTGVGQDPLQFVHSPADYGALLLKGPTALRACLALDNLFIVFYEMTFLAFAVLIERAGAHRTLVRAALGGVLLLGFLDLVENCHFMVMLSATESGVLPLPGEIAAQVMESLVKFHVSYFALFLFAVALPRTTRAARVLAALSWGVQLPVGVLIYVTPQSIAVPLVFVRFVYFVTALALVAVAYGGRIREHP